MAAKKQTLSTTLLDAVLTNATYTGPVGVYAALYTAAPTATVDGTEVATAGATGYLRMLIPFGTGAAAGSIANDGAVDFPVATAAWGICTSAAICAAGVRGVADYLYFGNLTVQKDVGLGDQLSFAIGALRVTES